MSCYSKETLSDRLDDLIADDEAMLLDQHLLSCGVCASSLGVVKHQRSRLHEPFAVEAPPLQLKERIRRRHAGGTSRSSRVLRYAASFAAGVLVTIAFNALGGTQVDSPVEPSPVASETAPSINQTQPPAPRRIH